ncbi:DUF982 domain-containing protein [Mesorhizobium sp. ES1-1]|uniref:DUF982 domain-containing protein n=1 Tax=Mesorhizobium sp. ES1-1 TaxID=2876629 RepID=UPI001CCCC1E3|nr:DUF982 domain-containing protein [Mesorhizobium sp. ES1-1]MBZ9674304.1 DUF982 domain-containing protein [Mesorhizobium sp. ES1-1]
MTDTTFEKPAKVRLREGGKIQQVTSAQDASILLDSADWPGDRTEGHRVASQAADEALSGDGATTEAFNAFILAAREADILVEASSEEKAKTNRIFFERSVCIRPHGGNSVREVKSVNGACEILIDWPHAKRGPYYQSAREVVQAALDGKATPHQAREAFVALAGHADILIDGGAE